MYLYLVQHGEAKSAQEDPNRPLTERGRRDAKKAGALAAAGGRLKVGTILHSGKRRALETALILAECIVPTPVVEDSEGLLPLDDPALWATRLTDMTSDTMLVGHLPHLAGLASLLLTSASGMNPIDFKMGGILCLRRTEERGYSVAWMIVPEILP